MMCLDRFASTSPPTALSAVVLFDESCFSSIATVIFCSFRAAPMFFS
jgi:hypothetical protein